MAETHETIADIIAEMRDEGHTGESSCLEWVGTKMRNYADRLDAAHRRERGDCAKLREAMKHIKDRLPHMLQYMRVHWEDASSGGYFDELMLVIDAALSAPPRNCDVGTAKEQAARFFALCNSNKCPSCPCRFTEKTDCALIWAQMPYEEGAAK